MAQITFKTMPVITSSADHEGVLMLADEQLLGVLVRLDAREHGRLRGSWFLEAGFGPCSSTVPQTFPDLDGVEAWAHSRLS